MRTRSHSLAFTFACLALAGVLAGRSEAINPQDSGIPGWISGLRLSYASSTTVGVSAGGCRDDRDVVNLKLPSAKTIAFNAALAQNTPGVDTKELQGVAAVGTSGLVTGTGTAFLTPSQWNARELDGTATIAGISTTVTGTGTKWASGSASSPPLALNDLVGNATAGYRRVTAILSDTSITVASTFTISGATLYAIENPTLRIGPSVTVRVLRITSATSLVTEDTSASVNPPASLTLGFAPNVSSDLVNGRHFSVWILAGGDWGLGLCVSTQRTTLYNAGHFTSRRRIGWVLSLKGTANGLTVGNLAPFTQRGSGLERTVEWVSDNLNTEDLLSSANANLSHGTTSANPLLQAGRVIPPGVRRGIALLEVVSNGYAYSYMTGPFDPSAIPVQVGATTVPGIYVECYSGNAQEIMTAEITVDPAGRCNTGFDTDGATPTFAAIVYAYVDELGQ